MSTTESTPKVASFSHGLAQMSQKSQKALQFLGYKPGTFPVTDRHAVECITFPVDQHLSKDEMDYMIQTVSNFYSGKP